MKNKSMVFKNIQMLALLGVVVFSHGFSFAFTSASNFSLFWVENLTTNPNGLSSADFEINNVKDSVCSKGASNYCPTEKLVTLRNNTQECIFNLTRYINIESNGPFENIDVSCSHHVIKIQPHLTTIIIEGYPSNILNQKSLIRCKYKDYYDN